MTKQSSVKLSVIGLLLAVAIGAPVASILGNAPSHRSTASLDQREAAPSYAETAVLTGPAVLPVTVIEASAPRQAAPKKARGEWRCEVRGLESVSDGNVRVCGRSI